MAYYNKCSTLISAFFVANIFPIVNENTTGHLDALVPIFGPIYIWRTNKNHVKNITKS